MKWVPLHFKTSRLEIEEKDVGTGYEDNLDHIIQNQITTLIFVCVQNPSGVFIEF